jgi:cyclophilin family peptidyl-prolyl cis-trans isomerase
MGHEGDAPGWFEVVFEVALKGQASRSKGSSQFTVRVHPDWAPRGAARFKELVEQGFYDDAGVFQVLRGVVATFGLPAKPQPKLMRLAGENATHSNVRGTLSFTSERSSKIVINLADNSFLNNKGFAPFGEVMADGMTVVERFYSGNKDDVDERRLTAEGNAYLDEAFPLTTKIVKVFVKPPEAPVAPRPKAEAPAKKEAAPAQREEAPARREAQCLPVAEGTECYREVTWALERGVQEHPAWYPGLTASSSREDFQAFINKEKPTVCPTPCAAARKEAQCLTVAEGTECFKEVTWALEQGVQEHPEWYPGLTASSSREDFQAFIHKEKPAACPTPCAAARK